MGALACPWLALRMHCHNALPIVESVLLSSEYESCPHPDAVPQQIRMRSHLKASRCRKHSPAIYEDVSAFHRTHVANPLSAKNGEPRLGTSQPGLMFFGKRTCKPNSVVCGHSSRRRVAADTHQRPTRRFRQLLKPPCRIGPMRSATWLFRGASLPIWSCSVWGLPCLRLTAGAVRSYRTFSPLPRRWRLRNDKRTRQAGPTRVLRFQGGPRPKERGVAEAVSFLWHWPSMSLKAHVPDVIRHTALRSSDFPPPATRVTDPRQRPPGPPASP